MTNNLNAYYDEQRKLAIEHDTKGASLLFEALKVLHDTHQHLGLKYTLLPLAANMLPSARSVEGYAGYVAFTGTGTSKRGALRIDVQIAVPAPPGGSAMRVTLIASDGMFHTADEWQIMLGTPQGNPMYSCTADGFGQFAAHVLDVIKEQLADKAWNTR